MKPNALNLAAGVVVTADMVLLAIVADWWFVLIIGAWALAAWLGTAKIEEK